MTSGKYYQLWGDGSLSAENAQSDRKPGSSKGSSVCREEELANKKLKDSEEVLRENRKRGSCHWDSGGLSGKRETL